jgi:tetratricopeptide (TPR) repeat protein
LLRAKILAQQGEYDQAIQDWGQALALTPGNQEAQRGVELAHKIKSSRWRKLYLRANLLSYAVLLLLAIGLIGLVAFILGEHGGNSALVSMHRVFRRHEQHIQRTLEKIENSKSAIENLHKSSTETTWNKIEDAKSAIEDTKSAIENSHKDSTEGIKALQKHIEALEARWERLSYKQDQSAKQWEEKFAELSKMLALKEALKRLAQKHREDSLSRQCTISWEAFLEQLDSYRNRIMQQISERKQK